MEDSLQTHILSKEDPIGDFETHGVVVLGIVSSLTITTDIVPPEGCGR